MPRPLRSFCFSTTYGADGRSIAEFLLASSIINRIMDMNQVPSLTNPREVSRRRRIRKAKPYVVRRMRNVMLEEDEKQTIEEWRLLRDSGRVHIKYLQYTPEDIDAIGDIDLLKGIFQLYNPSPETQNIFEEAYVSLMRNSLLARFSDLL